VLFLTLVTAGGLLGIFLATVCGAWVLRAQVAKRHITFTVPQLTTWITWFTWVRWSAYVLLAWSLYAMWSNQLTLAFLGILGFGAVVIISRGARGVCQRWLEHGTEWTAQ
jgi:hypothetical protein